jgi:hypothetical protein
MLEGISYVNHNDEELIFNENGIYIKENDLRQFSWDFEVNNNRIGNFSKGQVSKKLVFYTKRSDRDTVLDMLHDLFESDIYAESPGKFVINDQYMTCYVTGIDIEDYLLNSNLAQLTLEINTDKPYWVKEKSYSFIHESAESGLGFPFGFPFGLSSDTNDSSIVNDTVADIDFEMILQGASSSPSVQIAGHDYQVNIELASGEYVKINSIDKTITKYDQYGNATNVFSDRNKDDYIFEKIPSGTKNVSWVGEFDWTLKLFEVRSTPKWTT